MAASLIVCGHARRQNHVHHALYQSSGKRTLGAGEGAVLRASGEGTVEKGGELRVRNVAERVVGEDIFLEGLATIGGASMLAKCIGADGSLGGLVATRRDDEVLKLLTSFRCAP